MSDTLNISDEVQQLLSTPATTTPEGEHHRKVLRALDVLQNRLELLETELLEAKASNSAQGTQLSAVLAQVSVLQVSLLGAETSNEVTEGELVEKTCENNRLQFKLGVTVTESLALCEQVKFYKDRHATALYNYTVQKRKNVCHVGIAQLYYDAFKSACQEHHFEITDYVQTPPPVFD